MKKTQLIVTAAAGLLLAANAQAQVEIRISGAVAFRDTAYRAIRAAYGAQLASQNPADSPSAPSALLVTWTGQITNTFGSQTVTIRANYNGAVAGIQDLTQNRNVSFLASSTPGDTNLVNLQSDLGFSSVFQRSTAFTSPTLADAKFGLTPVFFVKSSHPALSGLTNITPQQFRVLAANGTVPAWFLTGNTNDTSTVYFISRDPTAGQRVIVEKENKFTGSIISYLWNTNTSSFNIDAAGRNATQIRDALNVSGPAISYLTGVDAVNVNNGANILGYAGNKAFTGAYSSVANNHSPVNNGQYTQWGYEHLLSRTTASGNIVSFRTNLISRIQADLATSAYSIPLSKAKVERTGEGSAVSPLE